MVTPTGTRPPAAPSRGRRLGWLWVPVVFLVGLLAGGIVVAAFSNGTTVRPPGPTTTVTAPAPSSGGPQVSVDPACLQALRDAHGAYALLARVADAIRRLDVSNLDEIVLQLGQLRHQLGNDLSDCHATARLPDQATPSR